MGIHWEEGVLRRERERERERDCVTFDRYFSYKRLILRATRGNSTSINRVSSSVDDNSLIPIEFFLNLGQKFLFARDEKKK